MLPSVQEFLKRTSIHGCERITDNNRYSIARFLWVIFVAVAFSCLVVRFVELGKLYCQYNTVSKYSVRKHTSLPFPAVTICNLSPFSKQKIEVTPALENYLLATSSELNVKQYATPINWTEPEYKVLEEEDLFKWYDMASHTLEKTLHWCQFNTKSLNCGEDIRTTETNIGRCFTFNRNGSLNTYFAGNAYGLNVQVNINQEDSLLSEGLSAGIKVFVHDPKVEPSAMGEGTLLAPGTESFMQVHNRKFFMKPYPHSYNGEDYCLDTKAPDFVNPLKYHDVYDPLPCVKECLLQLIIDTCECVHPSMAARWKMPTCNRRQMLDCFLEGFYKIEELIAHTNYLRNRKTECNCLEPCTKNEYSTTTSSAQAPSVAGGRVLMKKHDNFSIEYARNNILNLHVFFDELITTEVAYEAQQTFEEVMVSIGGFMGLFLGGSVLSVLEILEFIASSLFLKIKKKFALKKTNPLDETQSNNQSETK